LKYFHPQKIVLKLSEVMVGSGIWDPDPEKLIPDPGSLVQRSKRHRISDPQHRKYVMKNGDLS